MLYLLKLFAVFKKPFYVSTKVSNSRTTQHEMKLKERSWKLKEKASNETKKYLAYISLAIHKPITRRCFTCESAHCYKVYRRVPCNARCRHNHTFTPILDGAGGAGRAGRPEFPPSCPKDLLRAESQIHATYYWLIIIYLFIYLWTYMIYPFVHVS